MAAPQSSDAHDTSAADVEKNDMDYSSLRNDTVRNFTWQDVTVTIKDRRTKKPKAILANVDGYVEAGKIYFYALNRLLFLVRSISWLILTNLQVNYVLSWAQAAVARQLSSMF